MTERLPTVGADSGAWGTVLNGFLGVAHNADGTLKAPAKSASTFLASSTSIGATTITVNDNLPHSDFTANNDRMWVVIGAFSATAELRSVSVKNGTTLTVTTALASTHAAGAPVAVVQDNLYVEWFGVRRGFLNSQTGQAAALNRMFVQCQYFENGYSATIYFGPHLWQMDAAIDTNQAGVADIDLGGGELSWAAHELGAGNAAFALHDGVRIKNGVLTGTFVNPVAPFGTDQSVMDGMIVRPGCHVTNVTVQNFRNGFVLSGFHHAYFRDVTTWDTYYGFYLKDSPNLGDVLFDHVQTNSCAKSAFGAASGTTMGDWKWDNCHLYGAPCAFYFESGALGMIECEFSHSSGENLGNAFVYSKSTAAAFTIRATGNAAISGTPVSSFQDASLAVGVFVNDSTTDNAITLTGLWQNFILNTPSHFLANASGKATWRANYWNADFGQTLHLLWDNSVRMLQGSSTSATAAPGIKHSMNTAESGIAQIYISPTGAASLARGDLVERVVGDTARRYQTAGQPPWGVSLETADGSLANGAVMVARSGQAYINVQPGNTVAAAKYLKPDGTNNGRVVQATSFSDGPIVGFSIVANNASSTGFGSANTVLAQLLL